MTRDLTQYDHWTVKDIESRQRILAEMAVAIWSLPY